MQTEVYQQNVLQGGGKSFNDEKRGVFNNVIPLINLKMKLLISVQKLVTYLNKRPSLG